MIIEGQKTYKAFISYSWTTPELQDWVLTLANRLVSDGIDVVLDKWDLKKGHDTNAFMERSVTDSTIDRVLIILDKGYAEKANARKGGVGTETQIISPEIYKEVRQEKFIPIIYERNEQGQTYAPAFLHSRLYIDLSNEDTFEENYEQLLRTITDRPTYIKPELGILPKYLTDENHQTTYKTNFSLRQFDHILRNKPKQINISLQDFLDQFLSILPTFAFKMTEATPMAVGKQITDALESYTSLKDDFVIFFDKLFRSNEDFDIDIIIHFLEQALVFTEPKGGLGSYVPTEYEQYKIILHELFLSLIALVIKYKKYHYVDELINSKYEIRISGRRREKQTFVLFYQHVDTINVYYNNLKNSNYNSPVADILINRVSQPLTQELFIEADLTCYYVGELNGIHNTNHGREYWFPITYIYKDDHQPEMIKNLISRRHFERIKSVFNVSTPSELTEKFNSFEKVNQQQQRIFYGRSSVLPIYNIINAAQIASER